MPDDILFPRPLPPSPSIPYLPTLDSFLASSHSSGRWKWALMESPRTTTPRGSVPAQNTSSYGLLVVGFEP